MAFKAFNWKVMQELDLKTSEVHNCFHAALFVFSFQTLIIGVVYLHICTDSNFVIEPADKVQVLGARFICTILMHLQVESDLRQGLKMMKYLSNQPFDFSNPGMAFVVACMQIFGGLAAEVTCIIYLSSLNKAIDTIIRFVALASIAKVDDFYALALPKINKIKKPTAPLVVTVHRRDW